MKRFAVVLGIVVVILIVLVVALPFFVDANQFRPRLEAEFTKALGRDVKLGNLALALYSGSVKASDLSIADDPKFSKVPFLTAKSLAVAVDLKELIFSKKLTITGIDIQQPDIALIQNTAGDWNFSSLGSKSAETHPADPPSNAAPLDVSAKLLKITDARISLERGGSAKPQALEKVNVEMTDFSPTSSFPFKFSANVQGGGQIALDGKAGPIDTDNAAATPLNANLKVDKLDLVHAGFIDAASGLAGLVSVTGTLTSEQNKYTINGDIKAEQLKLAKNGTPAKVPVDFNFALLHDAAAHQGTLSRGDIHVGKAQATLTGTYKLDANKATLNMKFVAPAMQIAELTEMLPPLAVELPRGSSLQGGTLNANFAVTGPEDKLDIKGTLGVKGTRLANFDLGSQMTSVAKLAGIKINPNTDFENISANVHDDAHGVDLQNISVVATDLGEISGAGTVSPTNILDFKMHAKLKSGGIFAAMASNVPFSIQGPATAPKFIPDMKGVAAESVKSFAKDPVKAEKAAEGIINMFRKKSN
ncbi:MAG TPA: AsmA family protein [Humisphaera sp.]|nr:AsmA family protein [Humisphaera sp.]